MASQIRTRTVIDLPPGPGKIVRLNVKCSGGSKQLELVGQEDTLRVFVNAKGEPDEWESPAGSGNIWEVHSPGEQPTKKRTHSPGEQPTSESDVQKRNIEKEGQR